MRKTRDLFTKIGAIKGIFHVLMATIKDKNGKVQAEEIKRWQEYTEELYKKSLTQITMRMWSLT